MAAFADSISVSSSVVQKYLGKNGHYTVPNGKTYEKIKNKYPQVSMNWLVNGSDEPFSVEKTEPLHLKGRSGSECCIALEAAEARIKGLEGELEEKKLLISLLRAQVGK